MKKTAALILSLVLLLAVFCALSEGEGADFSFEGKSCHVTYSGSEIVEGRLNVKVDGFGSTFPIRNGKIVVIAWVSAVFEDGTEERADSVSMSGTGLYTYLFDREELPKAVLLYPNEDPDNGILLWQSEEASAAAPVFSWKGYEMTFPYMTADLETYGLKSFQGSMVLLRLAPTEGTFAYSDFEQRDFALTDPDGVTAKCKYYVLGNDDRNPVTGLSLPAAQQGFIDLLFEMADPTPERLAASAVTVRAEEGDPLSVPLGAVPQTME